MLTVVKILLFQRQCPLYWTAEEGGAFAAYVAEHPTPGDVVPESVAFARFLGVEQVRASRVAFGLSISPTLLKASLFYSRFTPKQKPTTSLAPS